MVQTAIISTSDGGPRINLVVWRKIKYSKFNSLSYRTNASPKSCLFLNCYLLSLSLLTLYYHKIMVLLVHFIFLNGSFFYFLYLEWWKYLHIRDAVSETASTEEITVLGHQLITYDHKFQMKAREVLNIKVVCSSYPSITLAFDAFAVFEFVRNSD